MSSEFLFSYNFSKALGICQVYTPQPCCWVLSKALRMCRVYTEQPHRWLLWEQGTHSLCYSLCRLKSAWWTKGSCISNTYHKFPLHETSTAEVLSQKSSTPEGKSSTQLNWWRDRSRQLICRKSEQLVNSTTTWWRALSSVPTSQACTLPTHTSCKPGRWEDTEVKILPLMTTGRISRKTRQCPKYQTPRVPKEAILSTLRMGW